MGLRHTFRPRHRMRGLVPKAGRLDLRGTAGFTLVEELVTVAVIGVGLAVLVAMISTGTIGVRTASTETTADRLAQSQLELVKDAAYSPDPTAVPYPMVAPPSRFSVEVGVEYWTAPNGPFVSTVRNDGMQRITVTVNHDSSPVLQIEDYKVDR